MMPRLPRLGDALFRLLEVNARYYGTLGRVTADFLHELAATLETPARPAGPAGEEPRRNGSNGAPHPYPEAAPAPRPAAQPATPVQPIILLEAEADQTAIGVFLVANHLDREVQARPQAWPFYDPPGTASHPRLVFDPEVIALAPEERVLVKIIAIVDRSLQPEVRYRCEVSVPALADTRIPVVIRRRPDRPVAAVPSEPPAVEARVEVGEAAAGAEPAKGARGAEPKPAKRRHKKKKAVAKVKRAAAASPEEI